MYAIRVYKNYDTGKYLGAKLVNIETLETKDFKWDELRTILKYDAHSIKNMELDKNGNVRLKNLNPDRKIKYYKQNYVDNLTINHYCVIVAHRNGLLTFIADSTDNTKCEIHFGKDVTVGNIANTLGINNIKDLKLYNAKVELERNTYRVYMFNGAGYTKLANIADYSVNNIFRNDWDVELASVSQEGLILNYLEHKDGIGKAMIPEGVWHLEQFGGMVNHLELPPLLHSLGEACFRELDDLLTIKMNKSVAIIPKDCFRDSSLQAIKFSGYEQVISDGAFEDCYDLKCGIMTNANKIGDKAFLDTSITSLITYRAIEIGRKAFYNCDKLKKVKLGERLKVIDNYAFKDCSRLEYVEIPSTVTNIGRGAFDGCTHLKSIKLPSNVTLEVGAIPNNCEIIWV